MPIKETVVNPDTPADQADQGDRLPSETAFAVVAGELRAASDDDLGGLLDTWAAEQRRHGAVYTVTYYGVDGDPGDDDTWSTYVVAADNLTDAWSTVQKDDDFERWARYQTYDAETRTFQGDPVIVLVGDERYTHPGLPKRSCTLRYLL